MRPDAQYSIVFAGVRCIHTVEVTDLILPTDTLKFLRYAHDSKNTACSLSWTYNNRETMHLAGEYGVVTVLFKAHVYFVNIAFTLLSHCQLQTI